MYQGDRFLERRGDYSELEQPGSNTLAAGYTDEN